MYSASEIEAITEFAREARGIARRDADASVRKTLRKLASIFERIVKKQSADAKPARELPSETSAPAVHRAV